ncbi:MAG: hypothetical protein M1839_009450 [Geoglossum umbratile]|nr:MAG: hypothetical protein M1839_009450 [Geoglossum umbratile]
MAKELVFVTGITGNIGFRTLIVALRAGYRVRGAVRREGQIDVIKKTASVQPYLDNLEFIVVSDITKEGAFDNSLDGVDYILHIASPLPVETDNYERDLIEPAIKGTIGILESASKIPTIKRVVITSSVVILFPTTVDPDKTYTEADISPAPTGPYANGFEAYGASKILAQRATDRWYANKAPGFSIVRILPSFVVGRNELVTSKSDFISGSNAVVFGPLVGDKVDQPTPGISVHLEDVANAHVQALDPRVANGENFILSSDGPAGIVFDDIIKISERLFPDAVKSGVLPLGGTRPTIRMNLDTRKTEETFGWKHKSFEEQVAEMVGHWVELNAAA